MLVQPVAKTMAERDDPVTEILLAMTMAYVSLCKSLIDAGSLDRDRLVALLDESQQTMTKRDAKTAVQWLAEVNDILKTGIRPHG